MLLPVPARETRFEEMKRYVEFSPEDAALLAGFREAAAPHFERIAQEFYDRIRLHEAAHAVFTGEAQIARLQRSLVRWLGRVFGGTYDEAYFADTTAIGRVHVKVGLPQRYMFTAMALIRLSLMAIAEASGRGGTRVARAICRILDLELAIMLESYRDDSISRVQHALCLEKEALGRDLAQTQHRYVNAVELARVLIVGLDPAGGVRLFNREAERVTGFARDEVLGRDLADALGMDPDDDGARVGALLAAFRAAEAAAAPGRDPPPIETTIRGKAGHPRVIRWHLTHAPADDDDVAVFAIGLDTTDERARQDHVKQQERLAAIGTLAAGLAHEIRNPLNGAQLHVTELDLALRDMHADADLLDTVHVVRDEIRRLGGLVTEFLDFARPRPLQLKPVVAQELLRRAAQMTAAQAQARGVAVALDLPPADIEHLADRAKLEQVLLNLTQNAIEALEPGGRVVLRARRQPRTVTLEVEDDGPGIPPGTPIFDAFFSTKAQGTGLGLSITHRIVTDHGGTIDYETGPGRTLFRVLLPVTGPHTRGPPSDPVTIHDRQQQ
ncbi:MAG: PAS domain-containing protein [Myxococcales bacterium]|nr:PAS domain-containing protein [Myxococcales bacterium]